MINDTLKGQFFKKSTLFVLIPVFLVALLLPMVFNSFYIMSVLINCLLFASMGYAWNLISGYGGMVSICHAGFIAIGAYTCFLMYINFGISPILSMPIGILICYIFATIMGRITLKYRGPFFSISTIVFIELFRTMLMYFKDITNGSSGLVIPYSEPDPLNLLFPNNVPYYYIALVVLLLCMLVCWLFINSKSGYYLRTIKGDQDAAESLGIDAMRVKLRSFQVGAVMTSVIGAVYALFFTYIEPATICSMDLSIKICSIVIIGGIGTFFGPLIGAFVLIPLSEVALRVFPDGGAQLFYGLGLIIIILVLPGGIESLFSKHLIPYIRKKKTLCNKDKERDVS